MQAAHRPVALLQRLPMGPQLNPFALLIAIQAVEHFPSLLCVYQ